MNLVLVTLKKILFWSYDRGTWQYDIMCVLILAFIFLTPNGLFKIKNSKLTKAYQSAQLRNGGAHSATRASKNSAETEPAGSATSETKHRE